MLEFELRVDRLRVDYTIEITSHDELLTYWLVFRHNPWKQCLPQHTHRTTPVEQNPQFNA